MNAAPPELERLDLPARPGARAGLLLVMLAGAYDAPQDFVDHGLLEDCSQAGLAADLTLLRTDLAAVAAGRLADMLHGQVMAPARSAGYRRIVLGGISLGAMMALTYQDEYPDRVDALLLLAPYPGNRAISGAIAAAGGLAAWQPGELPPQEGELRAWRALKQCAANGAPPLWLGYGAEDRFAAAQRMMAAVLPDRQRQVLPGGHSWPVWVQLWRRWLAAGGGR